MVNIRIELGEIKIRGKQSVRTAKGISYIPKATRDFQKILMNAYLEHYDAVRRLNFQKAYMFKPCALSMTITCFFKIPVSWSKKKQAEHLNKPMTSRPDCDNIAKLVADTFNEHIYKDDSQIVKLNVSKRWADKNLMEITITAI